MAITFLFLFILGRYFYVQVLWRDWLIYKALDQWTRELPIVPSRGIITDRNGRVLVENDTAYTVYARSNAVQEKIKTSKLLSQTLDCDEQKLYEKLTSVKASEITVAKRVGKEKITKLAQLSLDGVHYSLDNLRSYPCGSSLCQVLGFTSSDNVGVTGVEKYYEELLKGRRGELLFETDLIGIELDGAVAMYLPAEDGYNIALTIDYGIQALVENVLKKVAEEYQPAGAECIVLNPNTFEILAMANYPDYDLNEIQFYRSANKLLSTAILESKRIRITYVIEPKTVKDPMCYCYLNGKIVGISTYLPGTDSFANSIYPAKLVADSTYG
jgi:stage V sporulation protein D (sporulation-specific penicillin-binding protein)